MVDIPQGQKYRRKHDPYNGMEEPDIRPDFLARKKLSAAENDASKDNNKSPFTSLLSSERNQHFALATNTGATFRNSVRGTSVRRRGKQKEEGKVKGRGIFRRAAPTSVITALLAGGAFFFFMSQTMLGPFISTRLTEQTDFQFTSYNARNQRLFRYLLNGGGQIRLGVLHKKYTTFSPVLKKRLAKNGIEVGHIASDGSFKSGQIIGSKKTVLKFGDDLIDADSFQTRFATDANFRESYYKAKRGRIAGFFDDAADRFYTKKGATRDIFSNYRSTGDAETDTAAFQKTVNDRVTGADAKLTSVGRKTDDDTGEEYLEKNGEDLKTNTIDGDTPEAKARTLVNSMVSKVSAGASAACTALKIANMLSVTVNAYQMVAGIAYFQSLMEPISKMMAGEGDASGINALMNFFTTETTSKVPSVDATGATTEIEVTGSPLQSEGAKLILNNNPTSTDQDIPYSFNSIMKNARNIAFGTGMTHTACDVALAASAVISLASNAIPGGALASFVISAIAHTVGNIVITGVISAVLGSLIPYVAKMFVTNTFEKYTGIPAGNFFFSSGAVANSRLATSSSSLMPASIEYLKAQNVQTKTALAQEAEVDRLNRSPFDITSSHTFLGSLLSKFAFAGSTTTFAGIATNFGNLFRSSLNVFNPVASAEDGEDISYAGTYQPCDHDPELACDIYGTELVARDFSTIDIGPDDPTYISVISPNLDKDGNIKKKSELAKYISFCAERESPWGVIDANIMNELQTDFGIANSIYLVENVVDIINAAEDIANRSWGNGDNCKMKSSNPRWDNEFKYYQLYVEDMRYLSRDQEEKNPVQAYLEEHDKTHPIDTSFEGTLARTTGMTKDDVAFMLEYVRYSQEVANYNPSTRYAFGAEEKPSHIIVYETIHNDNLATAAYPLQISVDKRNYAV